PTRQSQKSYAEVLKSGIHREVTKHEDRGSEQMERMEFVTTEEDIEWLRGTYIGQTYEIE
ncbi:hypothetical protein Ancab_017227, partial [Ancistrocladus abbreviatus]